jgi:hypothetical protein
MNTSRIYERATCPYCFGQLVLIVKGEEVGEHLAFTVCGGACRKEFLPPWPERQWCEPDSRPIPLELAIVLDDQPNSTLVGATIAA